MENASERLEELLMKIDLLYGSYAKAFGLNSTSMRVLYIIYKDKYITQKQICEKTDIPKQTVNNAVKEFAALGYIHSVKVLDDKRYKALALTDRGEEFALRIIPNIENAEKKAVNQFSEEEKKQIFSFIERYTLKMAEELR